MSNPPNTPPQPTLSDQRLLFLNAIEGATTRQKLGVFIFLCMCDCFNHLVDSIKGNWGPVAVIVVMAFAGVKLGPLAWAELAPKMMALAKPSGSTSTAPTASSPSNP